MLKILAAAFMLGIVAADLLHLPLPIMLGVALVAGLLAAAFWRRQRARIALLALCCAALGAARLDAAHHAATPQSIWLHNDAGQLAIQGVIVADPQRNEDGQRAIIAVEQFVDRGAVQRAEGLILAKLPPYPERRYGDRVIVRGMLTAPRPPRRAGEFDYRDYLARKDIYALIEPKTITLVSANNGNPVSGWLLGVRDNARRVLLRELPEPQSSLAVGILLGLQSSIPADVYDTFSQTGTSHILVISGWNISIIGVALYAVAARFKLSQNTAFWLILGTIWLYTMFVGATPTVIRAAVMGTIVIVGKRLDRQSDAWTTLFVACWLMAIGNPQTLWDLGFQLSALATASLFAFGKQVAALLERSFLRVSWLDWAREALTATLAAQVLALPLILYQFGNLSIVAPLANVVLLPMVPYAMLFGALSLLGGLIWLPLGQWLALPAYLFLAWLTEGARLFAGLPWAATQIPAFPLWVLLAYYALVLAARYLRLSSAVPRSTQAVPTTLVQA